MYQIYSVYKWKLHVGNRWRTRRRLLSPSFHFQILESFFDVFNDQSRILIDELTAVSLATKENEDVDVYPIITQCAWDIICGNFFFMLYNSYPIKLTV